MKKYVRTLESTATFVTIFVTCGLVILATLGIHALNLPDAYRIMLHLIAFTIIVLPSEWLYWSVLYALDRFDN